VSVVLEAEGMRLAEYRAHNRALSLKIEMHRACSSFRERELTVFFLKWGSAAGKGYNRRHEVVRLCDMRADC
jgi:hypothetical protein